MIRQSEFNIGTLGHVDHGKTTLTAAISHQWTDTHSESVKRSMTIKLGYADALISKCEGKDGVRYTTLDKCEDGVKSTPVRRISLLDAPGHETLMATAIAGSSIIDAALFVISAAEQTPMPQTREHLMIINALKISRVIVVQTKIDVVGREKALANEKQIKEFIKGSVIENAPIIPVMANRNVNVDVVLEEIVKLKMPERDIKSDPIMYVARSFDVNRPGSEIKDLKGGVIGGSIIRGKFKEGDEIEIRPGINTAKDKTKRESYDAIFTKIDSLSAGAQKLDEAIAGGLIAIGTEMDPAFTKSDGLVGQIVGLAGKLPESVQSIELAYTSLNRNDIPKQGFRDGEPILLGVGTGTVVGYIKKAKRDKLQVDLKHTVCIDRQAKISVLRNFAQRWRLSGYGILK
ncbi:MAG: translation initiation factor IF-2 subunit gamma [Candidatus Micrarchaeota archaeon]|nr:translation initiation factor IF-2 subunit gamma [Candidatus Micrarchaeota archaeon]MDE1833996.1 translation initiation factor IF-2 subunit gamma [Candidatus Micrarchaeota archaeon]MDE1859502.1 translation initiation factor IF-2 subunit gamma [Candidatus Micrarchaeota archaeon]